MSGVRPPEWLRVVNHHGESLRDDAKTQEQSSGANGSQKPTNGLSPPE
jgi:hypothetical protein